MDEPPDMGGGMPVLPYFVEGNLVRAWDIRGADDLAQAERVIAQALRGEGGRCAFLQSEAYLRLRLAALYSPPAVPMHAYHERLRVTLTPAGLLTVHWLDRSAPLDARALSL